MKKVWTSVNACRIYIIFVLVFLFLSIFAPKFLTAYNFGTVLGTAMLNGIVVIGFTIVLICGHLDLSTVAIINLAGNLAIYVVQKTGSFTLGIAAAIITGIIVGIVNGLLVTKAKINSFIATLGMSTLLQGLVSYSNNAATRSITNFAMTDFLDTKLIPLVPNRALIAILVVVVMEIFMNRTIIGKNFYLVGGNAESAWYAGINTDRYLTSAFALNGAFAAFGGALYACYLASAMADIGSQGVSPLNMLIAASVLGGTSLSGGKGSILHSFFGVLTLTALYNGLTCFKLGYEMQIFVNGLVLIAVVLMEAISVYRKNKLLGSKSDLFA
ncbi:MAG: ABC transporter permease [Lachnospiraceae bacterium]|nr:ABC transporter permease [Lachnospiraceae bacterium]